MSRRSRVGHPWILRGLAALLLAAIFGYGPYHLYARSGFARYMQLRRELVVTQARNTHLRAENERLARESDALHGNPRAIEKVARADLGWVRPGEVLFDLGPSP